HGATASAAVDTTSGPRDSVRRWAKRGSDMMATRSVDLRSSGTHRQAKPAGGVTQVVGRAAARQVGIARADGVEDRHVFAVDLLGQARLLARIEPRGAYGMVQLQIHVLQQLHVVGIVRGGGDGDVKLDVRLHAVVRIVELRGQRV